MASLPKLGAIQGRAGGCLDVLQNAGLKTAQPYNTYYGGANWAPGADAQLGSTGAGMHPCPAPSGTHITLRLTCPHMAIHRVQCLSVCCHCRDKQSRFTI